MGWTRRQPVVTADKKKDKPYAEIFGVQRGWFKRYDVYIFDELRGPQKSRSNYYDYSRVKQYEVDTVHRLMWTRTGAERWAKRHLALYKRKIAHENLKVVID